MKKKLLISMFLAVFLLGLPSTVDTVFAEEGEIERESQRYDESRYDLMTYADDKWYQWAQKTGTAAVSGIKSFLWNINIVISQITLMIIYQLFSLDIIELTKDSIMEISSGTAGSLMRNLGMFALAIASLGVVIRAYIQQNWQAFFKIVTLVVISMALLFSIQSKSFNYVDLAHNISISIENAVMQVNPTLTESTNFEIAEGGDIANQVSVEVENKAYESLLYKPYLLLQYGTTNESEINEEGSLNGEETRINEYLAANPMTEEGSETRQAIAEREYKNLQNENIFAGNAFKTSAYIMGVIFSTLIQAIVFFFLALVRIMLQFAFVFLMILVPFMLFISLFPSFEGLVAQYIKGTFMVILYKAMAVFFVLVATSFITLSYEMADMSNDIYYRIFIQSIFSISIIFMYMKRQFVMDMLSGASPSFASMGAGEGMGRKMIPKGFTQRKALQKAMGQGNKGKIAKHGIAKGGIPAGAAATKSHMNKNSAQSPNRKHNHGTGRKGIGEKIKDMRDHVRQAQNGELPNYQNTYGNEDAATMEGKVKTSSAIQKEGSSIKGDSSKEHVNIQGENVSISPNDGTSIRDPKIAKNNSPLSNPKSMRNPRFAKENAKASKPTEKAKGNPSSNRRISNLSTSHKPNDKKPITQWEANQQLKNTGRNPYQHLNEQSKQKINNHASTKPEYSDSKTVKTSREGLLNQRSLLHERDNK